MIQERDRMKEEKKAIIKVVNSQLKHSKSNQDEDQNNGYYSNYSYGIHKSDIIEECEEDKYTINEEASEDSIKNHLHNKIIMNNNIKMTDINSDIESTK